jgi:CubicO group peptidase (beta-lactamase class C family)
VKIAAAPLAPAALAVARAAGGQTAVASDAAIRRILVERVDTQRQSVGIVVGVIEPSGRRIVSYGRLAKDDPRPLDGDTIFEIGSITKVFASLPLADAVQRHEVALTDPIAKYLPSSVSMRGCAPAVDAQLTFEKTADGQAAAVVLHQNGRDQSRDEGRVIRIMRFAPRWNS